MKNFETKVLGMLTLIDADSLACDFRILGLDVAAKTNLKPLLQYILSRFNSEDVEGSDDVGSSCYAKVHNHVRVSFSKKVMYVLVSDRILNSMKTTSLTVSSFLIISVGETKKRSW